MKFVLLCHKDGRKGSYAFKVEFWIAVSKNMIGYSWRTKVLKGDDSYGCWAKSIRKTFKTTNQFLSAV